MAKSYATSSKMSTTIKKPNISQTAKQTSSQVAAKLLVIYAVSTIGVCQATTSNNGSLKIFLNPRTSIHQGNSATMSPATTSTTTTTSTEPRNDHTRNSSADNNAWIESILIKIENLKLDGDQLHAKLLDAYTTALEKRREYRGETPSVTEAEGLLLSVSASQAPTDSGEDPLETTTIDSGNVTGANKPALVQSSATQYSIATDDTDLDDDLKLVDSNNVSAVIGSEAQKASAGPTNPRASLITMSPRQTPLACSQAYTQCALRKVCAPALRAYNDDCHDLINNRTEQCLPKCLKAMIALRSSEEGDDLANCDCQDDEYCINSKLRSQACKPQVDKAVDPKTNVSCSTASWICLADQPCSTSLEYYYRNCGSLFSQNHCSPACNNSLSILYRQPKAFKLINCHCDGSEEFACTRYKTYTERLCLNKMPTQTDADHQLIDSAPEEEGFNLTNDPATYIFDSHSTTDHNNEEADEDGDLRPNSGLNDNDATSEAEDSSSVSSNGIQRVEDNWIPLMSGRYFSNLQQQRAKQRQQQLQQQQEEQQLQQQRNRQQSQVTPNQGQRKAKQKPRSNNSGGNHENRRKHSRLFALGSTSSAAPTFTLSTPWMLGASPGQGLLPLPVLVLSSWLFLLFV